MSEDIFISIPKTTIVATFGERFHVPVPEKRKDSRYLEIVGPQTRNFKNETLLPLIFENILARHTETESSEFVYVKINFLAQKMSS